MEEETKLPTQDIIPIVIILVWQAIYFTLFISQHEKILFDQHYTQITKYKYPFAIEMSHYPGNLTNITINGVKDGLFPEYIEKILTFNLTYPTPRDKLFYGFWKNAMNLRYEGYFEKPSIVPKYGEKNFIDFYTNFHGKIAIYKNAYACGSGEFVINEYVIRPPFDSAPPFCRWYTAGPLVYSCDKACVFGHYYLGNYGHFIGDYMTPVSYTHLTLPTTERV